MCDFHGYIVPEMVKQRPVIVFHNQGSGKNGLATVIPLSTKKPNPIQPYQFVCVRRF